MEILPRARAPKAFGTSAAIFFHSANSPANKRRAIDGWDLPQMLRDELGHLEHTHLALTIEYRPE
jgi:hypothetical protein